MEGRRVNHSAPKRNPLYVMFLCLVAAVFVLLIVVIVLGAKLGAAQKALDIEYSKLEDAIRRVFGRKGDAVVEANIKALALGKAKQK